MRSELFHSVITYLQGPGEVRLVARLEQVEQVLTLEEAGAAPQILQQ